MDRGYFVQRAVKFLDFSVLRNGSSAFRNGVRETAAQNSRAWVTASGSGDYEARISFVNQVNQEKS